MYLYERVLGAYFRSLTDLEQEMGQWSLMIIMCTYYALTNALTAYAQVRYIDLGDNVRTACVYLYVHMVDKSSRCLCKSSR